MGAKRFDYRAMGARIKARRLALRLTQERLAERVGISSSFVGHIERGEKKASLETVARLGAALDMSLDYLITGKKVKCDEHSCALYTDLMELIMAYK